MYLVFSLPHRRALSQLGTALAPRAGVRTAQVQVVQNTVPEVVFTKATQCVSASHIYPPGAKVFL